MGNTSAAAKGRHTSGDDTGPSMTANKFYDSSALLMEEPNYRRSRAATYQSAGDTTPYQEKLLPTVFKWEGGGKEVFISGSFNNWRQKIPMARSEDPKSRDGTPTSGGDFYTILDLPEGEHQYKFYVDGSWQHNPNEATAANNMGTMNNVIVVKKSDFEVFEALALDSMNTLPGSKKNKEYQGSPTGEYNQDTPPRRTNEKVTGPPILPPHLLQVILNKDTPAHCEPTLLPEPNHVMLNHLYALSIKDGVMVLSGTHRFRKKYVTTLLYKPI